MVDAGAFAVGMKLLEATFMAPTGREMSRPMLDAYFGVLGERFSNESWAAAVRLALDSFEPTHAQPFPVPSWFLRPFRAADEGRLDAEAGTAFERVRRTTGYTPEAGTYVDGDAVRRLGPEIHGAFVAAGGSQAFSVGSEDGLAHVRRNFIATYRKLAAGRDAGRALPSPDRDRIAVGDARKLLRVVDPEGKFRP